MKPFADERFEEALRRARRMVDTDSLGHLHEQLLALLQGDPAAASPPMPGPGPRYLERIAVQMKGRMRVVPVGKIDYITANGAYAELHVGSDHYVIRDSMQQLEERLDPERFIAVRTLRGGPAKEESLRQARVFEEALTRAQMRKTYIDRMPNTTDRPTRMPSS